MAIYDGWREYGGPTLYGPLKTAVTADVLEAGLIFSAVILAFSLLILLPGIRGKERIFTLVRIVLGVFILASILLVNFGQEWEVASISTETQYRAGLRQDIKADIKVKIGLRSVNITLKGDPREQKFEKGRVNETVDYNERFHWINEGWTQGRIGFGPFASTVNQEFRAAQLKGLPYPILWIAEYFTLDGEGVRWGRHYRQAGYYTHICLWTAFPLWILSMILFYMVLRYGGYFMVMTGGCLLMGNILYATIRNPFDLVIPFKDDKLQFSWGWCFWLCMINGIICVILGLIVVVMDLRFHDQLATFFGVDVNQDFVEFYADKPDVTTQGGTENGAGNDSTGDYEDTEVTFKPMFRRPTNRVTRVLMRTPKKKPRPAPRTDKRGTLDYDDNQLYENVQPDSEQRVTFHKDLSEDNAGYDGEVHLDLTRQDSQL